MNGGRKKKDPVGGRREEKVHSGSYEDRRDEQEDPGKRAFKELDSGSSSGRRHEQVARANAPTARRKRVEHFEERVRETPMIGQVGKKRSKKWPKNDY